MSDATKVLIATPLLLLAGITIVAVIKSFVASSRAVRHIHGYDDGSLPFFLRWNHGNVIFFPHLLDSEGLAHRRRALLWQRLYLGAIVAAILYASWVRSLASP